MFRKSSSSFSKKTSSAAPSYDVVLTYALKALGRRRLTEKQLREKLQKRYSAPAGEETTKLTDHIERVVVRVKELNYVNDRDFAEIFIRDTMQYRPHGTIWIKQQLMKKGVDVEDIARAMEQMREEDAAARDVDSPGNSEVGVRGIRDSMNPDREYTGALEIARKKLSSLQRAEPSKRYEKLFRFLMSRGFSASIAFRVLDEIGLSRRGEMRDEQVE